MPRYIVQVTFHSAHNLPVADLSTLSSDPYIHATLLLPNPSPEQPPPLTFRTPTIRRSRDPEWTVEGERDPDAPNSKIPPYCHWIIGGVEASGFKLVLRLIDEDPRKHDDKLGRAYVDVTGITENMELVERSYDVQKRRAKPTVYLRTYIAALSPRKVWKINKHASVVVSVKVLGKDSCPVNKVYTLGPSRWTQHFSPLIGALTPGRHLKSQAKQLGKQKESPNGDAAPNPNNPQSPSSSSSSLSSTNATTSFIGCKLQLAGPMPSELCHPFVGYATFVEKMFTYAGVRGRLLNKAMHHQYRTVYSYDKATIYGNVPENESVALQFLRLAGFGHGGRLFTYIITLDSELRFTETGPEFAVNMLSKHTMHADVEKVIAFSGEFFIRRVIPKRRSGSSSSKSTGGQRAEQMTVDEAEDDSGPSSRPIGIDEGDEPEPEDDDPKHHNPKHYELVIDNDSGTYRPKKELLPVLRDWLDSPLRLGGLGRITAIDGFDEGLKNSKKQLLEIKNKKRGGTAGGMLIMRTGSSQSDVSSGKPVTKIGFAEMIAPPTKKVE